MHRKLIQLKRYQKLHWFFGYRVFSEPLFRILKNQESVCQLVQNTTQKISIYIEIDVYSQVVALEILVFQNILRTY